MFSKSVPHYFYLLLEQRNTAFNFLYEKHYTRLLYHWDTQKHSFWAINNIRCFSNSWNMQTMKRSEKIKTTYGDRWRGDVLPSSPLPTQDCHLLTDKRNRPHNVDILIHGTSFKSHTQGQNRFFTNTQFMLLWRRSDFHIPGNTIQGIQIVFISSTSFYLL